MSFPSRLPETVLSIAAGPWQNLREEGEGALTDPHHWVWRIAFHGTYDTRHCPPPMPPNTPRPCSLVVGTKSVILDYLSGEWLAEAITEDP